EHINTANYLLKMTEPETPNINLAELSFEQALAKLEHLISLLENNQLPLSETIANYKLADQLRQHCQTKLNEAKLEVDKIVAVDGDNIVTEQLDS
ncbi:MAG: exodeoxyribonuclease VII small subunit, partial [Pseudomonadota bacterium]